jgi:cytochrome c peroxidase
MKGEDSEGARDPLLGRVLAGRYRLTQRLGAGGMGVVYLAVQEGLERDVVVKVIRPEAAGDPNAIARFEREARMAASIVHPNIVTVHDFGRDEELFYLVMERLVGRSLRDVALGPRALDDGARQPEKIALDWPFASECVRQIALALAAAHAKDVLHRDLKPSNVFLLAGVGHHHVAKVLDFGLAKRGRSVTEITRTGEMIGTVGYASPEQLTEGTSDPRSDLFSLGVLWYELLTGKHPFIAETEAKTIVNQVQLTPEPPSKLSPELPPEIDDLVMRLLRKAPAARTSSAEELVASLDALVEGARALPPLAQGSGPSDATRRIPLRPLAPPPRASSWPVVAMTSVALVTLLGALWAAAESPTAPSRGVTSQAAASDITAQSLLPLPERGDGNEKIVALGRALYHDPILSGTNRIACSTCHPMENAGTTPEPMTVLGETGQPAKWNTPSTWNATVVYRQTWKGDVETIAEVIERPLFNENMMAAESWSAIEKKLQASARYRSLFDEAGLRVGRDGIGRALTEYIDHATPRNAPFDRFLRGDVKALDTLARRGAERFEALGCVACHQGIGIGGNMVAPFGVVAVDHPYADRGQCRDGTFCRSDADCRADQGSSPDEECAPSTLIRPEDLGIVAGETKYIFKVPSLRNVAKTAPYFHDGSARTLEAAIKTMSRLQLGRTLSEDDVTALVAFLKALSAELPADEVRLASEARHAAEERLALGKP